MREIISIGGVILLILASIGAWSGKMPADALGWTGLAACFVSKITLPGKQS